MCTADIFSKFSCYEQTDTREQLGNKGTYILAYKNSVFTLGDYLHRSSQEVCGRIGTYTRTWSSERRSVSAPEPLFVLTQYLSITVLSSLALPLWRIHCVDLCIALAHHHLFNGNPSDWYPAS